MNLPDQTHSKFLSFTTFSPTHELRTIKGSLLSLIVSLALFGLLETQSVIADQISYTGDPNPTTTYSKTANILEDVFGSKEPSSGKFTETFPPSFIVNGTGSQDVTFSFLYDDGSYQFQFGYYYMTETLLNIPTNTVAEKETWATLALSNAEVIIVDQQTSTSNIPSGAIRAVGNGNNGVWSSINQKTVILQGGSQINFFIIPNNTFANFNADASNGSFSNFDLNGATSGGSGWRNTRRSWPLFSYNPANPGLDLDGDSNPNNNPGSGEGSDQVMTFDGTTVSNFMGSGSATGEVGTMVAFEDLWRRPDRGNKWWNNPDDDFSDLIFFVGDVTSTSPVPEPSTVVAGVFLSLALGYRILRRKIAFQK